MSEQFTPSPASSKQEEQASLPIASWWPTLNNVNGPLWAIIIAMFYLSGFIVLNAHLSQFGLSDFELVSGRYLLAAPNFAFFLVCIYLFAGRAVVYTPRWISEDIQQVNRVHQSRYWSVVVFVHSFSRFIFFCCLSVDSFISERRPSLSGRLLYQTDKHLYVSITDRTVRFRADDIAVMVLKPEPSQFFWKAFEEANRNTAKEGDEAGAPVGGKGKE